MTRAGSRRAGLARRDARSPRGVDARDVVFFRFSGTRECSSCPSRSRESFQCLTPVVVTPDTAAPSRSDVEIFQRLRDRSVIGRARSSLSERACSVGDRGSPHSSRDGFAPPLAQRAAAREQRLAGARRRGASRPRHFLHRHRHGRVRRERRARAVPRRRMSGRGHRVARSRARLPRACRGADAVASASARSPRAPRSREASSLPPRVSRRMGKQSGRASFSCRLFTTRRGDDDARVFAPSRDTRLFVLARHTTDPRLTRSLSSFPSTSPKRRATTSAGRTATRCPCSWMAWRRTCRKA